MSMMDSLAVTSICITWAWKIQRHQRQFWIAVKNTTRLSFMTGAWQIFWSGVATAVGLGLPFL